MTILAIDSGLERTGYAIFRVRKYVTSATIFTLKELTLEKRISQIYDKLSDVIKKYQPSVLVSERLFFMRNQKTAISVSQAQGVALLLAGQNGMKAEFLTPMQIKLALTGYGSADKKSVQKMIKLTEGIDITQDDEADAVACGLAYILLRK